MLIIYKYEVIDNAQLENACSDQVSFFIMQVCGF